MKEKEGMVYDLQSKKWYHELEPGDIFVTEDKEDAMFVDSPENECEFEVALDLEKFDEEGNYFGESSCWDIVKTMSREEVKKLADFMGL